MRDALVEALTWDDLANGRGTRKQVEAYRELEWRRCAADAVYFIEKYAYLYNKEDGSIIKPDLWPVQRELIREWQRHVSTIAVKARQLGITTFTAHFALWEVIFKDAAKWVLISSTESKAKDIIDRIQATKDRLPEWMIHRAESKVLSRNNEGRAKRNKRSDALMRISYGFSEMQILTSTARSIKGAAGNIVLDEFTEHDEQERKWHMLLPAIDGGAMAIIIANGEGEDYFYQLYQRAKSGKSNFTAHFFWWGDDPRRLADATIDGKPALSFSKKEQVAAFKDGRLIAPWYERMGEQYQVDHPEADTIAFRKQYPTTEQEAFALSGNSRFSLDLLNEYRMDAHAREVHPRVGVLDKKSERRWEFMTHPKGTLRLYEEPKPGAKYVMGVDSAGGASAGDFAVCQVLRIYGENLVQACVLQAHVEPSHLAYEAERLGWYYNEALVVVEANFHGQVVRDRMKDGYYNLYLRKRYEKFSDDEVDNIGFWTDTNSKIRIIDQLGEYLSGRKLVLNDIPTIGELSHYAIRDNGTTGAPKGMYDDLVMGLAFAVEGAVDAMARKAYKPIIIASYGRPA